MLSSVLATIRWFARRPKRAARAAFAALAAVVATKTISANRHIHR